MAKLTKRLVKSEPARRRAASAARRPSARVAATAKAGSRERLCAAAAREFAARGFAGASVDRIARAGRVNKAMIYYHFGSKAALYREILRDMFQAVGVRARAAAGSAGGPAEKIGLFVEGIAAEAETRPHFPPIWLREIAEGGTHLNDAVLRDMSSVLRSLAEIVEDGARLGRFQPVSLLLIHGGIVAPLMMFFASGRLRARLDKAGMKGAAALTRDQVVDHLRGVTLGLLEGRMR